MDLAVISQQLDALDTKSQTRIGEINTRIEDLVSKGATKAELLTFQEELKKHAEDMAALTKMAEQFQLHVDKHGSLQEKAITFNDSIAELIEKNHKEIMEAKAARRPMSLTMDNFQSQKDMSFTGNTTGQVIRQDFDTNIYGQPFQVPHFRSLIRVGRTTSDAYRYIRATLKSGTAQAGVQPGALKPEIQYQFDGKTAPVIKIAGHVRLPEEMIDDIEGMTSYLQNYMPEEVLKTEDNEILFGDNTDGHFWGLFPQATQHVPSPLVVETEPWDMLADAIAQQQKIWMPANRGMVDPIGWMLLATRKSTDGTYSHPTLITGVGLAISGMPIVPHPLIPTDEYLVGDFTKAELKLRTGITVRFFDQDRDNAIRNMVTVVAEERAAFAVYYPEAFKKGTFNSIS